MSDVAPCLFLVGRMPLCDTLEHRSLSSVHFRAFLPLGLLKDGEENDAPTRGDIVRNTLAPATDIETQFSQLAPKLACVWLPEVHTAFLEKVNVRSWLFRVHSSAAPE